MSQVASKYKVSIIVIASLWHNVETMVPCASDNIISDSHLLVEF